MNLLPKLASCPRTHRRVSIGILLFNFRTPTGWVVESIYNAFSECAALNPDPENPDGELRINARALRSERAIPSCR